MSDTPTIAIRPTLGRRLVLEDGGQTLDGLGIAPRADMPAEGAVVPYDLWARKRLDEDDAEMVPDADLKAADKRRDARENPAPDKKSKSAPPDGAAA